MPGIVHRNASDHRAQDLRSLDTAGSRSSVPSPTCLVWVNIQSVIVVRWSGGSS